MGYRTKRLQDTARGLRAAKELARRERWPRERLERLQDDRLAELAAHAAAHSPGWRERLPRGGPTLRELPVLTKTELMDDFDELVTDRRLRLRELLDHLDQIHDDALYLDEYAL
jgi:hypothetical protein